MDGVGYGTGRCTYHALYVSIHASICIAAHACGGPVPDTPSGVNHVEPVALDIRLDACSSVQYEERDDVLGVKFSTDDGRDGWTPIERCKEFEGRRSDSDGTRSNPKISEAPKLPSPRWVKDVAYQVIDGTPGLRFRQGKTLHSYKWIPIVSSPIASRMRSRLKPGT